MLVKRLNLINRITISDGVELLKITESSVRRIFAKMEKAGLVMRIRGGIARITHDNSAYSYSVEDTVNTESKKKIASALAKLIINYQSIYFDSGSTLYRTSLALSNFLVNNPRPNLKIFTNSLKNLEVLQGLASIRLSEGDYRPSRRDFCGFLAESSISRLNFDVCVLGTDGISKNGELTTTDFDTAKLCMSAIQHSKIRILAADSSKFEKTDLITYADLSVINIIVTDSGIKPEYKNLLSNLNIKTIIV